MNLTFSQAVERTKDLAGQLKAARAHEADCAADHAAKQHIADIAGEAHEKACSHTIALEQERDALADHMAALVRKTGEPLEAEPEQTAGEAFDSFVDAQRIDSGPDYTAGELLRGANIFTQPADFQAQALANGEARMNEALDRAREGWG